MPLRFMALQRWLPVSSNLVGNTKFEATWRGCALLSASVSRHSISYHFIIQVYKLGRDEMKATK